MCSKKIRRLVKYEDARRVIKCTQKINVISCKQTDYVENHSVFDIVTLHSSTIIFGSKKYTIINMTYYIYNTNIVVDSR